MSLDGFEQSLLKSGGGDAPSGERRDAARAAVLRAAGVSAGVAAATLTATSAAGATATAATASAAKGIAVLKLVLLALVAAGAATTIAVVARQGERATESRVVPEAPVARASATGTSTTTTTTTTTTTIDVNELPAAPRAAGVVGADPLAVEAALLEAARGCLARGDRIGAKARLDEHRARFPKGVLAAEAELLRSRLETTEEQEQ